MKTAPTNKNVCLWQYNIAHAMLSMPGANNADKVKEIENLVRLYGALKDKKVLPPSEAQECHDNAAAMSGELARAYHSESAKTKNPETLALRREALQGLPRGVPRRRGLRADPVLLRRAAVEPRGQREEPAPPDRAVGGRGGRVHRRRQDRQGRAEADEGVGVRRGARLEERAQRRSARQAAGRPDRRLRKDYDKIPEPKAIPEREQKMLARLRHLHQLHQGPEGRRAGRDEVPQGEHLPPLQPLRRGDPAVPRHPREPPPARDRGVLREPPARHLQPDAEVRRDARARRQARRRQEVPRGQG